MHQRHLIILSFDPLTHAVDKEWSSFSHESDVIRLGVEAIRLQFTIIAKNLESTKLSILPGADTNTAEPPVRENPTLNEATPVNPTVSKVILE